MIFSSLKTMVLCALVLLGAALSGTANAAIVRSTNGAPVLSGNGNCVISGWEGSDQCEAAKGEMEASRTTGKEWHDVSHDNVVYFGFNKSSLTPQARQSLDLLAKKIHGPGEKDYKAASLIVIGYADRLGKTDYDQKLAMKRAQTVRAYLIGKGVKAKKIEVRSLGKSDPKANCPSDLPRAKLIDCLKEDRRVEIDISDHK